MPKAIAIVSGGLDSITQTYLFHTQGYELHLLSFDYGQRHKKELAYKERLRDLQGQEALLLSCSPFHATT